MGWQPIPGTSRARAAGRVVGAGPQVHVAEGRAAAGRPLAGVGRQRVRVDAHAPRVALVDELAGGAGRVLALRGVERADERALVVEGADLALVALRRDGIAGGEAEAEGASEDQRLSIRTCWLVPGAAADSDAVALAALVGVPAHVVGGAVVEARVGRELDLAGVAELAVAGDRDALGVLPAGRPLVAEEGALMSFRTGFWIEEVAVEPGDRRAHVGLADEAA